MKTNPLAQFSVDNVRSCAQRQHVQENEQSAPLIVIWCTCRTHSAPREPRMHSIHARTRSHKRARAHTHTHTHTHASPSSCGQWPASSTETRVQCMPRSSHAAVMSWAMVGSSDLSACPQSTSIGICAGTRLSSPAASVCVCVCVCIGYVPLPPPHLWHIGTSRTNKSIKDTEEHQRHRAARGCVAHTARWRGRPAPLKANPPRLELTG